MRNSVPLLNKKKKSSRTKTKKKIVHNYSTEHLRSETLQNSREKP